MCLVFFSECGSSVSSMSAGRAFQARGPATEKALSEAVSHVQQSALCGRTGPSVVATIAQFCEVLWCDTMLVLGHCWLGHLTRKNPSPI